MKAQADQRHYSSFFTATDDNPHHGEWRKWQHPSPPFVEWRKWQHPSPPFVEWREWQRPSPPLWNGGSGSSMLPLPPFHKNIIAKSVAMRNQKSANTSPERLLQVKATIYIERCASNIIPIYNEIANSASHLM